MRNPPDIQYGPRIKNLRRKAGLSQEEAAKLLGIARTTLIRYENESPRLPVSIFIQMTEIYNCSVFDILGVRDSKPVLEMDISAYYLLKAQARYLVTKEYEAHQLFGGMAFNEDYYNRRYKHFTDETVKTFSRFPEFIDDLDEILAEADKDTDFVYLRK